MSIRTKCSLFRALLIGLVLLLATLVLVGCPSAEDKQAEDMLGTNVKLPGVWESDYVSYTFNSLEYSGTIQLLFTENKLQISAPHGTSEVHSYTRNGISLTIEDPYASEGKVIAFFNTDVDRIKTMNGTAQVWYLRSADVSYNNYFKTVSIQGNMNNYMPSTRSYGICPCISI